MECFRKEVLHPVSVTPRDIHQQVLVLQGKTLIAVPKVQNVTPVSLEITSCRDEALEKNKGEPIYLGIEGHKLSLCCVESEGQPILKLEVRDSMNLYKSPNKEKPFVFYRKATGHTSTFESAAYPGWFLCTSAEMGKPVSITKDIEKYNIAFYLNFKD
ncbi:interleukin-36 gamma-like isoform X2 [Macrotis lagotis]|uniref:interleukin-36 gamma-like isoform X2 n=1 Tax=Macrotis lagotis TaxID=92651 RepID=UPI003D695934